MPHNPDWTREEVIIVADLLMRNNWNFAISLSDPRLLEVSELLRRADFNAGQWRDDAYRKINSVRRKYSDLYTRHPSYEGKSTRGGDLTEQLLKEFLADPEGMARQAARIRTDIIVGTQQIDEPQRQTQRRDVDEFVTEATVSFDHRGGAGFGSPEHNKLVEDASMAAVSSHYKRRGWNCENVSQQKLGWDITATKGDEILRIEVKGVSGPSPVVLLTRGEYSAARTKPGWVLAVVTRSLSDHPRLQVYGAQEALSAAVPFVHQVDLTSAFT